MMALAHELYFEIPLSTHGVTLTSRVRSSTQPAWLALMV